VALALRFTRDADAADDVVQNAFEKAIRHRRQFRGQARVSTWLHRIVTNEALMWLRAQRRRDLRVGALADVDVELLVDPAPDPLQDLDLRRAALRLREGIAELAPDERHVIERCVLPGRSYGEYGAESGLHPAAAKTRAFRARRRLHARLAES
jgi:RNA polymerase sigma-70 factor (ECF subfamily)